MGLETVALVALAGAAVVGAAGSIQAAKAAKAQGKAAQRAAMVEAQVSRQQGDVEAERIRDRNKRIAASQRTAFLKSGITLDGTAGDVIYDSAIQGELDALNAEYRGKVGYYSSVNRGNMARAQGNSQAMAYNYQAAGGVLTAASYGTQAYGSTQPGFNKGTTVS